MLLGPRSHNLSLREGGDAESDGDRDDPSLLRQREAETKPGKIPILHKAQLEAEII